MMPRLLQSRISPLSRQRTECLVEVIGKFVPGMRDIGFSLSSKEPKDRVVEDSEHLRRMPHAYLGMILSQDDIP